MNGDEQKEEAEQTCGYFMNNSFFNSLTYQFFPFHSINKPQKEEAEQTCGYFMNNSFLTYQFFTFHSINKPLYNAGFRAVCFRCTGTA